MKITIKNRKNQNIVVLIDKVENPKGLAFVMHGLGGRKEEVHIANFAKAFSDNGYTVVRFDATNCFGESDGDFEYLTITGYQEDLEDVTGWAKTQDFYKEPFCLAGHSIGGLISGLYSQNNQEKIKAVFLVSTVVSGKLWAQSESISKLKDWEERGYWLKVSRSEPGLKGKLGWDFAVDRLKHDMLMKADDLNVPVFMVISENDSVISPKHQKLLYDKIFGKKELYLLKDAPHRFTEKEHLDEIYSIFDKWIKGLE